MFGDSIIGTYANVIHIFCQRNAEFVRYSRKDEDKNILCINKLIHISE